ncbi:receptor-like protein 12, partial [Vigna radiata var. radiata]|uniref:Receptor-like protein 12 n=1 Tax=Vigna radiata var. radiata TaxID=3916 RepID=A0A1S3TET8_VIGRR
MLSVNGGAKGLSQYYKNEQIGGMLFVSNFHLLIYVFVFMGSAFELGCASTPSQVQLEANAIMNSGWWHLSPSQSLHICSSIDGIHCNDAGSVTRIIYRYQEGPIQLATLNLSAFKNLEHLEVVESSLYGTIPSEIGNLSNLYFLDLSHNSLQGEISSSLGYLTNLWTLIISNNKINGTLPISLSNIKLLQNIDISHNLLTGSLKLFSVEYFPFLERLDLSYNGISGVVPMLLCGILYLNLSFNNLNGPIPNC